jgi:hypothetical protein
VSTSTTPQVKDIPDRTALLFAKEWSTRQSPMGVVDRLRSELGVPEKVALRKVERLISRNLLDYGVSPYHAWLTPEGEMFLGKETSK